ncbi:LacI family DNA-binding transcriptional regulator [Cohnella suwonensis]|uniref:LacI family DNA-binding transcriptional regulator n=1 Tax=Cohnella suwonensis TaxID=696072 RepID=A0ABW0LN51_9BACL
MTMDEIAKLAGVSKSAVSIAINGKPGIGTETRERILKIAQEHGYAPKNREEDQDSPARSITFLVFANSGIVLEQYYQQPFFRELIHHIEVRSRMSGYSLLFSSVDMGSFERDIRNLAEEKQGDGIILLGTNLDKQHIEEILARLSTPLVVLDTCFETLPVHFVQINNVMGAYQAGSHLCELGHKNIGYIASNIRMRNFDDRKQGFIAALREHGLEIEEGNEFSIAPTILSSQESLKSQLTAYLQTGRPLPTAYYCECDYIAISAIKTLTELGFRVPDDVSVVGFDNISESVIVSPELTTVHVEKERMAQLAVDLLIQSIESEPAAKHKIMVDTRFIERLSSSSPAHASLTAK